MCGIVVGREYESVAAALTLLAHRGPDGKMIRGNDNYYIGHARLAIVDLSSHGVQPAQTYHGDCTAFNGEIYNYGTIADMLRERPRYRNEVWTLKQLLYESKDFMRILDGDFAIAHVNRRGELILARDFIGVVPLYYQMVDGRFFRAASEKKCLEPNRKIYEVRPGQTLRFDEKGRFKSSWIWDPISLHLRMPSVKELADLFGRACRRRYIHSDVPVAVALSGGLDSSLILLELVKTQQYNTMQTLSAVTVVVEESDELEIAQRLAQDLNVRHTVVKLTEEEIRSEWDRIQWHMETTGTNPVKWRGMVRNYFVAKYAKTKVILTGEGADEVFCGYPQHQNLKGLKLEWKSFGSFRSMPAINLDRVNKGGLAWGAEYRVPFLDRDLVLYTMGCWKEPGKQLLREVAEEMNMPQYVLDKPKYGVEEKQLGEIYEKVVNEK